MNAKKAADWINVIQAQKCSGQSLDWIVAGATLVPRLPLQVEADATAFWIVPNGWISPQSPSFCPDAPPPRLALVS